MAIEKENKENTVKQNPFFKGLEGESSPYVEAFIQALADEAKTVPNIPMTNEELNALRTRQKNLK